MVCKIKLPKQGRNESPVHYEERKVKDCSGHMKPIWLLRLNGSLPKRGEYRPPKRAYYILKSDGSLGERVA